MATAQRSDSTVQHPMLTKVRECSARPDAAAAFFEHIFFPLPESRLHHESIMGHEYCDSTTSKMFAELLKNAPSTPPTVDQVQHSAHPPAGAVSQEPCSNLVQHEPPSAEHGTVCAQPGSGDHLTTLLCQHGSDKRHDTSKTSWWPMRKRQAAVISQPSSDVCVGGDSSAQACDQQDEFSCRQSPLPSSREGGQTGRSHRSPTAASAAKQIIADIIQPFRHRGRSKQKGKAWGSKGTVSTSLKDTGSSSLEGSASLSPKDTASSSAVLGQQSSDVVSLTVNASMQSSAGQPIVQGLSAALIIEGAAPSSPAPVADAQCARDAEAPPCASAEGPSQSRVPTRAVLAGVCTSAQQHSETYGESQLSHGSADLSGGPMESHAHAGLQQQPSSMQASSRRTSTSSG